MEGCLLLTMATILAFALACVVMAFLGFRRANEALGRIRVLEERLSALSRPVAAVLSRPKAGEAEVAVPSGPALAPSAPPARPAARPSVAAPAVSQVSPATPAAPAVRHGTGDTLETQIGGKWFLVVGAIVFVLGIGFFVKMAFDNHWITETARVVIGGAVGLAMIGAGAWFVRRGYGLYGQILTGAGYVAIFISLYAAYTFYGLIDRTPVFIVFAATAAASAVSADRFASPGLALMAVIGGFLTPFLVGGTVDSQVTLLSYDALLVAGTMYLAHRRSWPLLNLASFALTALTFAGWAERWYAPWKYLRTEAFLVLFCAMFLYVLREGRRKGNETARLVANALWAGPVIFHVASFNNLNRHSEALLIYLTVMSAILLAAAVRVRRPWIRLLAWLACVVPFLVWFGQHTGPEWRVAGVSVLVALYLMHLLAQGERVVRRGEEPDLVEIAIFHLNGLGLFDGLYLLVDRTLGTGTATVALALAAWSGLLALASRRFSREAPAQGLALAFGMVGFAVGIQFEDMWAAVGWTAEATAIIWAALLIRKEWMRLGGALLLGVALVGFFSSGFFDTPAGFTVVMNSRVGSTLVVVALLYLMAFIHRASGGHLQGGAGTEIAVFVLGANLITVMLVTVEITSHFQLQAAEVSTALLARGMSLSLAWGLYGLVLVVAGIILRYRPIRYLAILLLAVTAAKVLVVDLSELGGVYRIMGFIGMGVLLLVGSYLYQRFKSVIVGTEE